MKTSIQMKAEMKRMQAQASAQTHHKSNESTEPIKAKRSQIKESRGAALGQQIKAVRLIKNLSLRDVEAATGISNAYLSQLESGKIREPSVFFLHKLATLFEVPIDSLFASAGYLKDDGKIVERHSFAAESLKRENLTPSEADYLAFCLAILRHSKLEFPNR